MKKLFFVSIMIFSIVAELLASSVELSFEFEDGSAEKVVVDDSLTEYNFDDFKFSKKQSIVFVKGLEKLKNLETVYFFSPCYYGSWDFLAQIPNLKNLTLDQCWISSFKFLENLNKLEYLTIQFSSDANDYKNIKKSKIDLKELSKLQEIYIRSSVFFINDESKPRNQWKSLKKLDFIPDFINVQNSPKLYLDYNQIFSITKNELKLLSQYSFVNLSGNPILKNESEVAKLKKANINFEAKKVVTKKNSEIQPEKQESKKNQIVRETEIKPKIFEHHQVLDFIEYGLGAKVIRSPFSNEVVYTVKSGDKLTISEVVIFPDVENYVKVENQNGVGGYISIGKLNPYSRADYQYLETLNVEGKNVRILTFSGKFNVDDAYVYELPTENSKVIHKITHEESFDNNFYEMSAITEDYRWIKTNLNGYEGWVKKEWLSLKRGGRLFITPSYQIYDKLIGQYNPDLGI